VAVLIPFGKRFSVDIGTAATTAVADAIGREESFSGFTDTQLRGSYVFGNDRVVTSLMVNIPTGQETQSLKEFDVTSNVASNFLLFPVNSYGNGFSATGGVAVAIPAGSWNVGVAGSLRLNSEYQPFSDPGSTSVRYQPGLEGRIRAGADRLIGSSRLVLGLTFSTFDNDQFTGLAAGSGRYSPGSRLIGEVNLTSPPARHHHRLCLGLLSHRQRQFDGRHLQQRERAHLRFPADGRSAELFSCSRSVKRGSGLRMRRPALWRCAALRLRCPLESSSLRGSFVLDRSNNWGHPTR
jgi:hypothetical protein